MIIKNTRLPGGFAYGDDTDRMSISRTTYGNPSKIYNPGQNLLSAFVTAAKSFRISDLFRDLKITMEKEMCTFA